MCSQRSEVCFRCNGHYWVKLVVEGEPIYTLKWSLLLVPRVKLKVDKSGEQRGQTCGHFNSSGERWWQPEVGWWQWRKKNQQSLVGWIWRWRRRRKQGCLQGFRCDMIWQVEVPFARMGEEQVWGGNQKFSFGKGKEVMNSDDGMYLLWFRKVPQRLGSQARTLFRGR